MHEKPYNLRIKKFYHSLISTFYYLLLIFSPVDPSQLLIFIVLIALSAFFSGTEIALMTLSKHSIEGFKREKRW